MDLSAVNMPTSGSYAISALPKLKFYQTYDGGYHININNKNKELTEAILSVILLNDKELTIEESIKLTQDINNLRKEVV